MPAASIATRVAAWALDAVTLGVLIVPIVVVGEVIDLDARRSIGIGMLSLVAFVYLCLSDASASGATLGKKVLGLRVVDAADGGRIGIPRAVGRRLVYVIGGLAFYLGWLCALVTPQHRALHDYAARTVVVTTQDSPVARGDSPT